MDAHPSCVLLEPTNDCHWSLRESCGREISILSGFGDGNHRPLLAMSVNHTRGVSPVTTVKLNFNSSPVETEAFAILWPLSTIAPHPIAVNHTPASSILASISYRDTQMAKCSPSLENSTLICEW